MVEFIYILYIINVFILGNISKASFKKSELFYLQSFIRIFETIGSNSSNTISFCHLPSFRIESVCLVFYKLAE